MEKGRGRLDADFLSPMGVPESVRRREENRRQRIATELEFMFPMPEPTQEELESGIKPQLRKLRRFLGIGGDLHLAGLIYGDEIEIDDII